MADNTSPVDTIAATSSDATPTGIMICGHGSRDNGAVNEFNRLSTHFKKRFPHMPIESGFLEFARPVIRDGLEALKAKGVKKIICVPGMLFAATHVKNDIPSEINNFLAENPTMEAIFARHLDITPALLYAAQARIEEAEQASASTVQRAETLLMVVGRGTTDPDANANIFHVTRMLWEGMGFGWAETCYSGVAYPLVGEGLERAVRLGYKRIIVFPWFLFTGILINRIYDATDAVAKKIPDVEFLKASYFNDHPKVIDTFEARAREAITGAHTNNMNCQLCKYRTQIIGYEHDQGADQVGHHHHVQGIGTDHDHNHGGHHHTHDHGGADMSKE